MNYLEKPYHPDASIIPSLSRQKRQFLFQQCWFKQFPWLHYDTSKKSVLCFTCSKASALGLLSKCKHIEPTFIDNGYRNWKKAGGKCGVFQTHNDSNCHAFAVQALHNRQLSTPVSSMLSRQMNADQVNAQKCLHVIFNSIVYLARQGLALRGHSDGEGNFRQLLKSRCHDVPVMSQWLNQRANNFTHHEVQDEILHLYADTVLRIILSQVRKSQSFAVMVDGTQDINRQEQESICIRYVDEELLPHEDFVGFYAVDETTGYRLAKCIKDCLTRYQLPLERLRGQTYDGASNMSGVYNGCQAIIAREQPLASYVHCSAHCTNLIAAAVCSSSTFLRDAVQTVNDFGVLCSASGKFKALLIKTAHERDVNDDSPVAPVRTIKPLCPTRWLVRVPAVNAAVKQYSLIMTSLEGAQQTCSTEVAAKAASFLNRFENPATLLCLQLAQHVLEPLESLNKSLQSTTMTVAWMLEAAAAVKSLYESMREDHEFDKIWESFEVYRKKLALEELILPRTRKPPARFCGDGEAFRSTTVKQHYRIEFRKIIDVAIQQLNQRLLQCPGLTSYCELETMLVSGKVDEKVADRYPELVSEGPSFQTQLDMFHMVLGGMNTRESIKTAVTLDKCATVLRDMAPPMRAMFPLVESLIRLLLVNPASSATAERSFSSLRRLKTYLRSTCGQRRLNDLALCHIHKNVLDNVNTNEVMKEFIHARDSRVIVFGQI